MPIKLVIEIWQQFRIEYDIDLEIYRAEKYLLVILWMQMVLGSCYQHGIYLTSLALLFLNSAKCIFCRFLVSYIIFFLSL